MSLLLKGYLKLLLQVSAVPSFCVFNQINVSIVAHSVWAIKFLSPDFQPIICRIIVSHLWCCYLTSSIVHTFTEANSSLFFFQNSTFFVENISAYYYTYDDPIFLMVNLFLLCPNQCISKWVIQRCINYVRGCCDNAAHIPSTFSRNFLHSRFCISLVTVVKRLLR